jgi:hypothetical protein
MFTRAQKKIFAVVLKGMGLHKDVCEGILEYLNENDLFVLAHAIGFKHKLTEIMCNKIDFLHEDRSPFFPEKFGVYCAKNGYGKLLEYFDLGELYQNSSSSYYSDEKNNPFIASLTNKHYEIAKRLYKRGKVSFGSGESTAIGQIEDYGTFKFFIKVYKPEEKWLKRYVSEGAASIGAVEHLKHLKSLGWKLNIVTLAEAAAYNQKEAFDWIEREILKERDSDQELPYGTDTLCRHLAYEGNLDMLRYLHARGYTIGDEIMYSTDIPEIVAFGIELGMDVDITDYIENGNVKILKYLSENGYQIPNTVGTFECAVMSLNCEFVEWLIERKCPTPDNVTVNFSHSGESKLNLPKFISLILSLYPNCKWEHIECIKDVKLLEACVFATCEPFKACVFATCEPLKMLNCPLNLKVFTYNPTNLEIVKWGFTRCPHLFSTEIMGYASLPVLQWLDKNFPNNRTSRTAYIAAIRNEFRFVKWLYYNNYPFDFPELYQSLFTHRDTSIFKWLYTLHPLPKETLLSYEPGPDHMDLYLGRTKSYPIKSWIENL